MPLDWTDEDDICCKCREFSDFTCDGCQSEFCGDCSEQYIMILPCD